ncbi:MAG: transposase [gamma proteobacterium symbiont of Lucinoma myriamae]|nr:transposase [gamma proteobacterium symbiont of Lucinoma myriamae]
MNKQEKRSYTAEFRESAVNLVISSDKSTASIAKELGIKTTTLYSWVNKARDTNSKQSGSNNAQMFDELKRLKKELAEVKEQRDILKKGLVRKIHG